MRKLKLYYCKLFAMVGLKKFINSVFRNQKVTIPRSRSMRFGRFDYAAFSCFACYAAGSVAIPVALLPISKSLGFSLDEGGMTEGGALHIARTIPIVFAMLACGFIAGRFGKRITMGISVLLMALGVGICAVAPGYSILFLAVMLAGVGEGIIEGLATPFVQDLHNEEEPGRYINFAHSFWSVGVLFTVLIVGFLLSAGVNWRILVGGVAAVGFLTSLIFLLPERKGHEYPEHPEIIKF